MGHKGELLRLAQSLQLNARDVSESYCLSDLSQIEKEVDVVFTGPVYGDDKDNLHRLADLFVLPSFTENFGAVVSDSLAYGVPVITTKGTPWAELEGQRTEDGGGRTEDGSRKSEVGGRDSEGDAENQSSGISPSLKISGRCGWWVDIGVEPLVEALREAMNMTDGERRAMGENGRRLVEARYTWPVVAGDMKKAYEKVLS